jgi:Leucine-rich repeat (LRR) protein
VRLPRYVTSEKDLAVMLAEQAAGATEIEIRVDLPELEKMNAGVGRVAVKSFAPLARFKKLESVWISFLAPSAKALAELAKLKLTRLRIDRCGIDAWAWIASMSGLTSLDVSYNGIDDLTPFAGLVGLKKLDLFTNKVKDLAPLAKLVSLEDLDVGYNECPELDLAPLANMKSLKRLRANGMRGVKSLAPLDGLKKLRELTVDCPRKEQKRFAKLRPEVTMSGTFY